MGIGWWEIREGWWEKGRKGLYRLWWKDMLVRAHGGKDLDQRLWAFLCCMGQGGSSLALLFQATDVHIHGGPGQCCRDGLHGGSDKPLQSVQSRRTWTLSIWTGHEQMGEKLTEVPQVPTFCCQSGQHPMPLSPRRL